MSGNKRFWPKGRGIFISKDKLFVAHVNDKVHLKLGCTDIDNNLIKLYEKMSHYCNQLSEHLAFTMHLKYGYLNSSLELIGNAMEISILAKFPPNSIELSDAIDLLNNNCLRVSQFITNKNGQIIMEIRNKKVLGITEIESMQLYLNGISELQNIVNVNENS